MNYKTAYTDVPCGGTSTEYAPSLSGLYNLQVWKEQGMLSSTHFLSILVCSSLFCHVIWGSDTTEVVRGLYLRQLLDGKV